MRAASAGRSRVRAVHRLIGWGSWRWRAILHGNFRVVENCRLSRNRLLVTHGACLRLASTTVTWHPLIAHARAAVVAVPDPRQARSALSANRTNVVAEAVARIALGRIGDPFAPVDFIGAACGACQVVSQVLTNLCEGRFRQADFVVRTAAFGTRRGTSARVATSRTAIVAGTPRRRNDVSHVAGIAARYGTATGSRQCNEGNNAEDQVA